MPRLKVVPAGGTPLLPPPYVLFYLAVLLHLVFYSPFRSPAAFGNRARKPVIAAAIIGEDAAGSRWYRQECPVAAVAGRRLAVSRLLPVLGGVTVKLPGRERGQALGSRTLSLT